MPSFIEWNCINYGVLISVLINQQVILKEWFGYYLEAEEGWDEKEIFFWGGGGVDRQYKRIWEEKGNNDIASSYISLPLIYLL